MPHKIMGAAALINVQRTLKQIYKIKDSIAASRPEQAGIPAVFMSVDCFEVKGSVAI
jgi:hypothetical protein